MSEDSDQLAWTRIAQQISNSTLLRGTHRRDHRRPHGGGRERVSSVTRGPCLATTNHLEQTASWVVRSLPDGLNITRRKRGGRVSLRRQSVCTCVCVRNMLTSMHECSAALCVCARAPNPLATSPSASSPVRRDRISLLVRAGP